LRVARRYFPKQKTTMRKPKWSYGLLLPLLGTIVLASCAVDDRTLKGEDDGSALGGADDGTGGTTATAGTRTMHAGASSATAGSAGAMAGDGGTPPGGGDCPDLDHNDIPDCEESLTKNGSFDNNFADWTPEANIALDWQMVDADASDASGSMGVENSNAANLDNLSLAGSAQCISLDQPGAYAVVARVFIPPDQQAKGSGGVSVAFYEADLCAGAIMIGFGGTSSMVSATGSWQSAAFDTNAPENARSMSVRLVVLKPFKDPPVQVLFDNVAVKAKD
jgi:hypothetical protein